MLADTDSMAAAMQQAHANALAQVRSTLHEVLVLCMVYGSPSWTRPRAKCLKSLKQSSAAEAGRALGTGSNGCRRHNGGICSHDSGSIRPYPRTCMYHTLIHTRASSRVHTLPHPAPSSPPCQAHAAELAQMQMQQAAASEVTAQVCRCGSRVRASH